MAVIAAVGVLIVAFTFTALIKQPRSVTAEALLEKTATATPIIPTATPRKITATPKTTTPTVKVVTPTPRPTATPELLENGWYLYHDPDGEFSFEYPKDTFLQAGTRKTDSTKFVEMQFRLPVGGYQGMSIRLIPNPKNLQGMEIIDGLYQKKNKTTPEEVKESYKKIEINGMKGFSVTMRDANTEITIIIPVKGKYFMISPVHSTVAVSVDEQTLKIFYQVIESLKY
ncbi:MAG TPA: hypothetical protein PKW33_10660 [Anaerolineaceae bacterium]|nr:hypothetical protein [Anaerolineaceae bacterium]HPN52038.1 hypothetical protein [Anaerolineaceae bacterium]